MHGHIISNNETCNNYTQKRNLLPELDCYPKLKDGFVCRSMFKEYNKRNCKRNTNGDLSKIIYLLC